MWVSTCFKENLLSRLLMILILQLLITSVNSCSCATTVTVGQYDAVNGYYLLYDNCLVCSGCSRIYVRDVYDNWNGNGLTSVYTCLACSSNCISCTNPTVCTTCSSGYTLDGSQACVPCTIRYGSKCSACNSIQCTTCILPYVLNTTATGNFNIYQQVSILVSLVVQQMDASHVMMVLFAYLALQGITEATHYVHY